MCLNCGCGDWHNNHGDPFNLTIGRLRLIATRNSTSIEVQAKNILATVMGYIDKREPLGNDEIKIDIKRLSKEAPTKAEYVSRKDE